jgi:hypothetical protein
MHELAGVRNRSIVDNNFRLIKMKFSLFVTLIVILAHTHLQAGEILRSNCSWKPKLPTTISELQDSREPSISTATNPSDEEFLVKTKRRVYFYSLPHKSCKTDVFIVYRDQVSAVDYFPERVGGYTDFARVSYYSKSRKDYMTGWVEMDNLCRLNFNGHCPSENNLKPKKPNLHKKYKI